MIGITNSTSKGKIDDGIVLISLVTNQSSSSDLLGVSFVVAYEEYSERFVWNGNQIAIIIPKGVSYTISPEDVDGYKTPNIYTGLSVEGSKANILLEYKCTFVTVVMEDNQASYNDISATTATVSATGMTTKTISNGNSVKVPTGNVCTISWSSVNGYRTPDAQTFTAIGTSVTKTGTYQTEILIVNTVTPSNFSGSYTITVSGFGSHTTASEIYKIPFGTSYTVSASSVIGFDVANSQSYTANSVSRTVTIEYTPKPVDLSLVDIFGNPNSQTTANCYVVKANGTYMFPLVYGNAIKNGDINSSSYTKINAANCGDFVDYNDQIITSPYIENVSGMANGVELSMADTDGIFTDISIVSGESCRYVQFRVVSIPDTGANGVISILDSNGVVMWSWHIWVWADDLTPVTITNSTGVNYNILPVNLAAKKDKDGYMNWYYQWGRHVPMLLANSSIVEWPVGNGTNYGVKTFKVSSACASSYGEGIKNPHTFYVFTSANYYNWFAQKPYYNLWDAACTSTGNSDNNVVKTIYDPCPVGFKMPNGNTFTRFSKNNVVGAFNNGWNFKRNSSDTTGVFFPASGSRNGQSGNVTTNIAGNIWLSSSDQVLYASYFLFNESSVNSHTKTYRAHGLSVRPVQE